MCAKNIIRIYPNPGLQIRKLWGSIRGLPKSDRNDLEYAKQLLENPGLAARITDVLGKPIEKGFELLPDKFQSKITGITEDVMKKSLDAALWTLDEKNSGLSSDGWHKIVVALSGGVGGAFGLPALAPELLFSTTIMLRSIGDIARSEGEDLSIISTKLECLNVFAFGGESGSDDAAESGYFAIRSALASAVAEAAQHIAKKGIAEEGAPVLVRLITKIAARYEIVVTEKVAGQAIPIIGAAGGAIINTLFLNHFQDMAHGHFTVRRLERKYGEKLIRTEYEKI